jgi:GT2 family glycosyltransferase
VIPSRNRPESLVGTITSVLSAEMTPQEIVVVDQSSEANTRILELADQPGPAIRYHRTSSIGVSRARNIGLQIARSEAVALIDDDVLVAPDWLAAITRALRELGPLIVVTGQVRATAEHGFAASTIVETQPRVFAGRVGADVLFTGNMAMYRSVVSIVGDFDERLGPGTSYPAAEDNDFGFRLLESGFKIAYRPDAVVSHRAWRTNRDYLPLRWRYGRGQGAFFGKHLSLHDRYILGLLVKAGTERLGRIPRRLAREPRQALGDVAYVLGLISGVIDWCIL